MGQGEQGANPSVVLCYSLTSVRCVFSSECEGKVCRYFKLSAQCKWETDKSDTTGEAQFGEGIIEKAEGG